jgi:hypothetical protein
MARSTLPPIVWDASCGHRNAVRSDVGGYATNCKTCGAKVWVPKRGAGRAPSSREAAGRFRSRSAAAVKARTPDRPPRHVIEDDLVQPAGRGLSGAAVARMAEGVSGMLARRRPGSALPDAYGVEGVVIPPSRGPAAAPPPDLDGKQPLRARLKQPGQRHQPELELGDHVVPRDGKLAPPCGACRSEPRRSPEWTRAAWQVELTAAAVATGLPGVLELCGKHVRQVPAELVSVRRLWQRGAWLLTREDPAVDGMPAPMVQPNKTIALSGIYG